MQQDFHSDDLAAKGLNLQSVFNLSDLPEHLTASLAQSTPMLSRYNQLVLFAHGGPTLWANLQKADLKSTDPIDEYSTGLVTSFLETELEGNTFEIIYPGTKFTGLQELGTLAGWHHPSIFRIGINEIWGTWFAYRVAVLTTSNFEPTTPDKGSSPCQTCTSRACVTTCPAGAVTEEGFDADTCFAWRRKENSTCKETCLARLGCPVGIAKRYPDDQIKYHYGLSMKAIERMT